AGTVLARRIGLFTPFELRDQVIVGVLLFRDEAAIDLARDVDHAVVDGEDLLRVVVLTVRLLAFLGGGEVGVEVGQVFAVEQVNGAFVFGVRGQVGARADAEHGGRRDQNTGKQAGHHWGPFGEKPEAAPSTPTH